MTKKFCLYLIVFSLFSCSQQGKKDNEFLVQINSGDIERQNSIVTVENPYVINNENYYLTDPEGQIIPVQMTGQKITFVLPDLSAGEEMTFELVPSKKESNQKTAVRFEEDAVEFLNSDANPVLQYRSGTDGLQDYHVDEVFLRGGYLHPVYSPGGRIITEQYTPGRPHQNGIWTGWYRTEWNGLKPDFWSAAERTGSIEVQSIDNIQTGPVYGLIETEHYFIEKTSGSSTPVLSDNWRVQIYNTSDNNDHAINLFDLEVIQKNITDHPFTLFEHIYGGVGFRGSDQWLGEENMQLVTSEGENREEAHMSSARWVMMSGEIDGEMTSIAILAHPENLRFPEPVFINQREPFFTFAPLQAGDITLEPGDIFSAKYRYVTLDSEIPSIDFIEGLWQDYANPVEASMIKKQIK